MDARARNRKKLWMRSEQAMGISSMRRTQTRLHQEESGRPGHVRDEDAPATPREQDLTIHSNISPPSDLFRATKLENIPRSTAEKLKILVELDQMHVHGCTRCRLCETRTNTVFGEGDADAKIFFIGEGPGENEDLQGRPFVGRAGELLNKMIVAMGLQREQVYIANIVKCRPPGNRAPAPDEVAACTPFLEQQLATIRPTVIVTLGLPAMQYMLQTKSSMGKMRGQWHEWRGIKLMPTYHPAYVLRSYTPEVRATVWGDLQKVMAEIGIKKSDAKI
jgi:uracil-DNA glycosylase